MVEKSLRVPADDISGYNCKVELSEYGSQKTIRVKYHWNGETKLVWDGYDGIGLDLWKRLIKNDDFLIEVARAIILTYGCAIVNGIIYRLTFKRASYNWGDPYADHCECQNMSSREEEIWVTYDKYFTYDNSIRAYHVAEELRKHVS